MGFQNFKISKIDIEGPFLIDPLISTDERGFLLKDYSIEIFEKNNLNHILKETFYTNSKKGVIRAIHFQKIKQQAKLVRCLSGEIYDIIVDLREDSPTFGEWRGFYLSEKNNKEIYVPENFGHGYYVLKEALVSYKCSEVFYPDYDDGIIWNDKTINIDWPISKNDRLIISEKDKTLKTFKEYFGKVEL